MEYDPVNDEAHFSENDQALLSTPNIPAPKTAPGAELERWQLATSVLTSQTEARLWELQEKYMDGVPGLEDQANFLTVGTQANQLTTLALELGQAIHYRRGVIETAQLEALFEASPDE